MIFHRGLRRFERRTVIVHVPPGPSLRGVLVHAYRDCFVLAHGHSLDDRVDLPNETVIPRGPGVWIQAVQQEPSR